MAFGSLRHLAISHSGAEARAHAYSGQWGTMDGPYSQGYDFDVWGNVTHKYGWGGEVQGGGAGQSSDIYYSYTGNRRNGFTYDAAGNLSNDLGQNFTYDVTGQQTQASYSGYSLQQSYDGDGLRVRKSENRINFRGYADIDRYDLYGGLAPASAHIFLELLPHMIRRLFGGK